MNFLELQKEYAQLRGELQNGSIAGMNADEISLMKKNINREVKELAGLHPPFLCFDTRVRTQTSVTLMGAGLYSATGTKNVPTMNDTGGKLRKRDIFRLVENGTYRRRIIDVLGSSTTIDLDHSLAAAATTAVLWTAYRDTQPLPHNMNDINLIIYEDGEGRTVNPHITREGFQQACVRHDTSSQPSVVGINVFTNVYTKDGAEYTFSTSCTVTNNSRVVEVYDTERFYPGDVALLTTTALTESLHTFVGVSTTTLTGTLYLDRKYAGATGQVTIYCNPREYVDYITFYPWPTDEEDILIRGYVKPHDMIYDTDECIFPDHLCPLVVIGALLKDKLSMEVLTDQWLLYYEKAKKMLHDKKEPTNLPPPPRGIFGNTSGLSNSDYPDWGNYPYKPA